MTLQPISQTTVRFAQMTTSGLLVIQAAIATTVIGAFAPINLGWLAASSASAQAIPTPGSVSTTAADLKPFPVVADCSTVMAVPIRLPNCSSESLSDAEGGSLPGTRIDPSVLRDAELEINQHVHLTIFSRDQNSVEMQIVFPLP